jgi:hypothetical protein
MAHRLSIARLREAGFRVQLVDGDLAANRREVDRVARRQDAMRPRAVIATLPDLDVSALLDDDDVGMEARDLLIVLALLAATRRSDRRGTRA